MKMVALTDPALLYHGRALAGKHAATFCWPGSGFELAVCGGDVRAQITGPDATVEETVWIGVYVNGVRTQTIRLQETAEDIVLADELPCDRVSLIRVVKLSEHKAAVLKNLSVSGELRAAPIYNRRIVCIGDSITCGFGVLAKETDPFTAETEDVTCTCGWMLADAFGADCQIVSASGFGLTMANTGSTDDVLPRVYPYTVLRGNEKWDYDLYQPDLVMVNLGTNDEYIKAGSATVQAGVRSFLAELRRVHPFATLVWVYGFMINGYTEAIRQAVQEVAQTDKRVYFLAAETATGDAELGAAGHPSALANARLAKQLQPQIEKLMNW